MAGLFREHGSNVWFDREAAELLPQGFVCPKCGKAHFTKETDIMDVWFDSGSTWAAVAAERRGSCHGKDHIGHLFRPPQFPLKKDEFCGIVDRILLE